jgi:lysophospholipase L1-like esterase
MRKRSALLATCAALLVAAGFMAFGPGNVAQAATPVRIMALGDSITGSPGCWRALLWQRLVNNGITNIDFVGTLPPQGCGFTYDGENEGHGGFLVTNVASQNQLVGWLSATNPNIVMMHFGTNDVWSNIPASTILAAYTTLVNQMRANNPNMKILVAKIIPVAPSSCTECPQRTILLNNAIPGWAAGLSTAASPITVVDQWTGWVPATDTSDGVHPSDPAGITKMANNWYVPLASAINGTTVPTTAAPTTRPPTTRPPTTAPPTTRPPLTVSDVPTTASPTRSTTPTGSAACTATYTVTGQWPGGFQGSVTVRNSGGQTITNGWIVRWTFANGQTVTQFWQTALTSSGSSVTATSLSYNASIPVGGTQSFGFLGSWTSANTAPTPTCSVV